MTDVTQQALSEGAGVALVIFSIGCALVAAICIWAWGPWRRK